MRGNAASLGPRARIASHDENRVLAPPWCVSAAWACARPARVPSRRFAALLRSGRPTRPLVSLVRTGPAPGLSWSFLAPGGLVLMFCLLACRTQQQQRTIAACNSYQGDTAGGFSAVICPPAEYEPSHWCPARCGPAVPRCFGARRYARPSPPDFRRSSGIGVPAVCSWVVSYFYVW